MPFFEYRASLEATRDIKAFLNLEAGLTRSGAADRKRTLAKAKAGEKVQQGSDPATALYLDLMKRALTNWIYMDSGKLHRRETLFDERVRAEGRDWPFNAHTMIGLKRLDNLQFCVEDVLANRVPGDLVETGVWRGGAAIFMRAILKAHGVEDRLVWAADSFEGLPVPNPEKYPADARDTHHVHEDLAVSIEQVKENFARYGLLDDRVRFLKGWFRDTLPAAPIKKLAVARLDGDMYESTMDALVNLYPRLSAGGYLVVDDYWSVPGCRKAVHDYRKKHGIDDEITPIDFSAAFWQRSG